MSLDSSEASRLQRCLEATFVSANVSDANGEDANVVDALAMIASALHQLGNAGASTPMGGLEAHGKAILEASENIQSGLYDVAEAIRELKGD